MSLTLGEAGAGKSTPDIVAEGEGELRGDPRQLNWTQAVKKSLVAIEVGMPVPQTDSGRLG